MIDTPLKAYWYGYLQIASTVDNDEIEVISKEKGHLDSLTALYPDGEVDMFEVETGHRKNDAYYKFTAPAVDWPRPVRKLGRHVVCGMMDARPVAAWSEESLDLDFLPRHAEYVIEYMPYMKVEHLPNGKIRLYTCSTFDTSRALEYLYKDAPVAKPSRKRVYDRLSVH